VTSPSRRSAPAPHPRGGLPNPAGIINAGIDDDIAHDRLRYDLPATPPEPFTAHPPSRHLINQITRDDQIVHPGELGVYLTQIAAGLDPVEPEEPPIPDTWLTT
jgi:hypothetical protein